MAEPTLQPVISVKVSDYPVVTNLPHQLLVVMGLFGVGGAYALPSGWAEIVQAGTGLATTAAGIGLSSIHVSSGSTAKQVLDMLETWYDAAKK